MKSLAQRSFAAMHTLALAVLLLTCMISSATTINSAVLVGTQLTITGTGFSGTPLVVRFDGKSIPIVSSSSTQIVATLSPVPGPGSYRLVVKSDTASANSYFAISGAPAIVASVALFNQTGPISTTTLFTPTSDGLFRVSAYAAMTGAVVNNATPWVVYLGWTDEAGIEGPLSLRPS